MRISASLPLVAFLTVALGAAQAAAAESKPTSRPAMEKAAKKACITGDVSKGIDLLGDLYVETSDATYVYNQARCFEQNHRWEEAIDRFREYLRKAPNLTTTVKAEVDQHIAGCEAEQAKLAPPPAAPPPPATPPPPVAPAATVNLVTTPAPSEQGSTSRLRTAGIVTASVGVLAVVGGMVCNFHANSLTSDLNQPSGWDRGKASSRDTYETLGWVGYGVGAAAIVTGATLFVLGGRSRATAGASTGVALTPVVLPGFASLSLRGSY
jgi:hypothetical protein